MCSARDSSTGMTTHAQVKPAQAQSRYFGFLRS
jgi:hypothetical protein